MSADKARFTTKDLSKRTWPDCERFFSEVGSGWCACMLSRRGGHLPSTQFPRRDDRLAQNLRELKELVWQDHAHGILVYDAKTPVGWCQYGPVDELPLAPTGKTPPRLLARDPSSQWRITCFLTRIEYRRQGVASIALAAAVESIRNRGGGWIEATPIAGGHRDPQLGKLRKTHGWRSQQVKDHLKTWPDIEVPGVGRVMASPVGPRACDHRGAMAMFERLGFRPTRRDEHGVPPWWIPGGLLVMRRHV